MDGHLVRLGIEYEEKPRVSIRLLRAAWKKQRRHISRIVAVYDAAEGNAASFKLTYCQTLSNGHYRMFP